MSNTLRYSHQLHATYLVHLGTVAWRQLDEGNWFPAQRPLDSIHDATISPVPSPSSQLSLLCCPFPT